MFFGHKWFKRSPYSIFYLQNNSAILIPVPKWTSHISWSFHMLVYFSYFYAPSTFFFVNEMFLKNSKPLWKHVFSDTIFMFSQIVYIKRTRSFFKSSLVRTKSQSTWYLSKQYLHNCHIKGLRRWHRIQNRIDKKPGAQNDEKLLF